MNKKILTVLIAMVAVTILASTVTPAFAAVVWTENASVVGETIISVPGKTPENDVRITFAHMNGGDHGIRDNLALYVYMTITTPAGPKLIQIVVAWYSDTTQGTEYNGAVMANTETVINQLEPWQLQVYKIGKCAIAIWTVPLEVPPLTITIGATQVTTPAINIPSGCIILNGYGETTPGTTTSQVLPSGYQLITSFNQLSAYGCLICPSWHYIGSTTGTTTIKTDYITTVNK